ncbi:MAG: PQQ-binding-like beta-propeller repeat protein [Planctomycetota bacterium]|nr:PQQ-binding-like beta-propeller repeat protein [Planctomycetota bacterium]
MKVFHLLLLTLALVPGSAAADWPQFRGPNSSGLYTGKPVPTEFGPGKNELWHLDLLPGHSSPCIAGKKMFLTGFDKENKKLEVLCIDLEKGEILWRRGVQVRQLERGHPSFNPASSSPATDGERVVAYFGSYGLLCFSNSGEKLWEIRMPMTRSYAGNATSPIITGDRVILYRGNHVDHFVMAVDKKNGREIWKVPQQEPFASELACTSCPIVRDNQLILHSARSVQALELKTGKLIWGVKCATTATSTPVLWNRQVLVAAWNKMGEPALRPRFPTYQELISKHDQDGDQLISRKEYPRLWIFHRPDGAEAPQNGATLRFESADQNRNGTLEPGEWEVQLKRMAAFRAGYQTHGMLSIPTTNQGWISRDSVTTLAEQGVPEVPSPLAQDDLLYFVKNGGTLTCFDLQRGQQVYRIRTGGRGTHYASPIICNQHLYTFSGEGKVSVIRTGREGKVVARNQLDDRVYASPAVHEGVLYVRTHSRLYAFGNR